MPLFGTFDTMPLTDLFQWVINSAASGTLVVTVHTDDTLVRFETGDIVALSSVDSLRLDFGQFMLGRGLISEAALHQVLARGGRGDHFKKVAVALGTVAYTDIVRYEQQYVEEMLMDLFFVEDGSFHFSPVGYRSVFSDGKEGACPMEKKLSTHRVMMEAMRRCDEWSRMKDVFPSALTVVRAVEDDSDNAAGDDSDNAIWTLLKKLGSPLSIGDICLRTGIGRFGVYQALYDLHKKNRIALEKLDEDLSSVLNVGAVETLVETARVLQREAQYEECREILSTVLGLEPDNRDARVLLRQVKEAQLTHLYQQIPPHKVPSLCMSRESLHQLSLEHRDRFLAERISGTWDVAMLVVATPLGELDTLRILSKLIHANIVELT